MFAAIIAQVPSPLPDAPTGWESWTPTVGIIFIAILLVSAMTALLGFITNRSYKMMDKMDSVVRRMEKDNRRWRGMTRSILTENKSQNNRIEQLLNVLVERSHDAGSPGNPD